jgi:hypothetical protein
MQKSKAGIVFSDYLARLLLDNISNNKYDNDLWNKCKIIYHGAEPNLRYAITKGEARSVFFSSDR